MFACKVNGKNFIAQDQYSLSGNRQAVEGGVSVLGDNGVYFFLNAFGKSGYFDIYIDSIEGPQMYLLADSVTKPNGYWIRPSNDYMQYNLEYFTSTQHTGWVNFSVLSRYRNEAMGTFEFEGVDKKGNTVKVTDGRFYNHVTGP